jgi:hypothetical protein
MNQTPGEIAIDLLNAIDAKHAAQRQALVDLLVEQGLIAYEEEDDAENDDVEGTDQAAIEAAQAFVATQLARNEAELAARHAATSNPVRVIDADVLDETEVQVIRDSITPRTQRTNARYNETDIVRVARHAHSEGRSIGGAIRDELGMSNASAYAWAKRLKMEGRLDVAPTAAATPDTPRFGVEDAMREIDGAA